MNKGIEALDKGLDLYDKRLDKVVPWNVFQETLNKLDEFRKDYSKEAANLIGDLKTKMKNGMDTYFMASQSVYEWCSLAVPLLGNYKNFLKGKMDSAKFTAQRALMVSLLNSGIEKMGKAQDKLEASSSSFNEASGKLTSLNYRLEADFSEKSEYYKTKISEIRKVSYSGGASFFLFGILISAGVSEGKLIPDVKKKMKNLEVFYKDLRQTIAKSSTEIDSAKRQIREEIRIIGDMKSKTEETKIYVEADTDGSLQQIITVAVDGLITKCKGYISRHKNDPKNWT